MTVLIAPDSFKGTYTAGEVADAVAGGITTPHDGPRDPKSTAPARQAGSPAACGHGTTPNSAPAPSTSST
jgi:hypothetical protein